MILNAEQHRKVKEAVLELVGKEKFDMETKASRGSQLGNLEILCEKILVICNNGSKKKFVCQSCKDKLYDEEGYYIEPQVFRKW